MTVTVTGIEIGQVWEAKDRRLAGRRVTIVGGAR